MHILITGAAGMIGRKLTERLVKDGGLNGKPIDQLTLFDVVSPAKPAGFKGKVEGVAADLAAPGEAAKAIAGRPDVVFHLAGVVSGEAELDFDKGYHVNLDGTRALLEAIRATGDGYRPKIVYTSSIAVFGAPFPPSIPDDFHLTPLTSYGTQKAIGRHRLCAARHLRQRRHQAPTINVRRKRTRRRRASSPASSASRSPASKPCCRCRSRGAYPCEPAFRNQLSCTPPVLPRMFRGASISRCLGFPARSPSNRGAAPHCRRPGHGAHPPRARSLVARIVEGWPQRIEARRARELGFKAEGSFDEIVRIHIDEDRGGTFVS